MDVASNAPRRRLTSASFLLLAALGCAGPEATVGDVLEARKLWSRADVRDYDLEWTSRGPRNARYRAFVRNGAVRALYSVLPDGREVEMRPAEPRFYGVDGLFTTILDEFEQLKLPRPFGQPKGTKAVLRFEADPRYGYPRRYTRDVLGSPLSLVLEVVKFEPDPPAEVPPPVEPVPP